jgi:hypothetical protein
MKLTTKYSLQEVVALLKDKYPDKIPNKKISTDDLCVLLGQQNVVRFLESLLEKEQQK